MSSSGPACGDRRLRADAAGNRARLVSAAQQVFGEEGVAAPLTRVAEQAGVGIATLYRRFPDRDSLIAAAFDDVLERYRRNAEQALAEPDPWEGFAALVLGVGGLAAENLGFAHLVQASTPVRHCSGDAVPPSFETVLAVLERAKEAGACAPTSAWTTCRCCPSPWPGSSRPPVTTPRTPGGGTPCSS
ncbi:TetR/AcrR family transcriptional regulator [Pedococcus sp. NPDC057267]|uniref:TetR/AcrR family transcriptional regulator n=1 Tax=Pedococcus sp. NPDC057267 TaxID=3346077 RepID=UPI00362902D7